MTYRELLRQGTEQLSAADIEEASLDAWYLLERASGMNRARYFLEQTSEVSASVEETFLAWIRERALRIPLQHILGDTEFMGLTFKVNRHVLIPRQDTEVLVEKALESAKRAQKKELRILDMCTGSGCIAISLACLGDFASVTAADISEEALAVARENAAENQAQVQFVHSDLFHALEGERYDMIVSNPPYIPSRVIEGLSPEVRDHDPMLALDGGADGLIFYRRLAAEGKKMLASGGQMLFEIGCEQAADVSEILSMEGYTDIEVIKDLTGKDRVVCCRKE